MIKRSILSSLAFWYWFPGEEPLTTEWAGELVAPRVCLLLMWATTESGEGSCASFHPKKCRWRALPEQLIWKGWNLGDWASPKTTETVGDGITNNTTDRVVSVWVLLLSSATISLLGCSEVELEIAGVVDPTRGSEVPLIGVVGVTRIWSNEGADVILHFGVRLDVVVCFAMGLIEVFHFLAGLDGAFLGVVITVRVTLLC